MGFIDTQLVTAGNYSTIADIHATVHRYTDTNGFQPSLNVSRQQIYNSLTVTPAHIKMSLHCRTFNSQLNSLDSTIICELLTPETPSIPFSAATVNYLVAISSQLSSQSSTLGWLLTWGTPEIQLILAAWYPRYIASGRTHRKRRFLCCCMLIHCCRNVFTAQLRNNERDADPQRTPLGTPLLLLRDVTAYVTRSSAASVRAII
jgi:hypothetical protein